MELVPDGPSLFNLRGYRDKRRRQQPALVLDGHQHQHGRGDHHERRLRGRRQRRRHVQRDRQDRPGPDHQDGWLDPGARELGRLVGARAVRRAVHELEQPMDVHADAGRGTEL